MTYGTRKPKKNWRAGKSGRRFRKGAKDYRLLEKMFYYYNRLKRGIEEIRAEQGYYQSGHKEGGGSSNHAFISDPTSQIAIKHTQEVKKIIINADLPSEDVVNLPERWVFVIEQTLNWFGKGSTVYEVLSRRYFRNESYVSTCADLDIENVDDYYEAKDVGLQYARECAIQVGLIKVF